MSHVVFYQAVASHFNLCKISIGNFSGKLRLQEAVQGSKVRSREFVE